MSKKDEVEGMGNKLRDENMEGEGQIWNGISSTLNFIVPQLLIAPHFFLYFLRGHNS